MSSFTYQQVLEEFVEAALAVSIPQEQEIAFPLSRRQLNGGLDPSTLELLELLMLDPTVALAARRLSIGTNAKLMVRRLEEKKLVSLSFGAGTSRIRKVRLAKITPKGWKKLLFLDQPARPIRWSDDGKPVAFS